MPNILYGIKCRLTSFIAVKEGVIATAIKDEVQWAKGRCDERLLVG
jgi:hypothetical protein